MFFKTIQRCIAGETAWIEEYTGDGEEPEHPAPALLITEAQGDEHGGGAGEDEAAVEEEEAEAADETATAEAEDDDGESSTGLAIAGLVVGALGVATGGFALSRTRKPAASAD